MSALPAPMTPADSRGRDLGPMPFDSDAIGPHYYWILLSPRAKLAALSMMEFAWQNNPAASIPNELGRLGNFCREKGQWWRNHGTQVLVPWVLCSDDRLYLPWLAEQANRLIRRRRDLGVSRVDWRGIRAAVFERDDYTCQHCQKRGGLLECDHVIAVAEGGQTSLENLVTSCSDCNRSKGAQPIELWRARQ